MREKWLQIGEFPDYAVSDHGRVMNTNTEIIKTATLNQQGIPSVLLMLGRTQHRRAVPLLVADMFIPRPYPHFDTPINLDGNRTNNHIDNLAWRPRWFAVKYHKQFKPGYTISLTRPIEDADTGEPFDNSLEAALKYGLLDTEILLAILNRTVVFPTNQRFQEIIA